MSTFAISFRLDHDATWSARYDSFMGEVRKCRKVWVETTSFCLVETGEALEDFERRLFLSQFAPSKDLMLVVEVTYDSGIARGALKDKDTLKELMPLLTVK